MTSLFDSVHGFKILMFPGYIRYPGVTQSHFDLLVAKQLLQDFQAHTGIEHVGGEGVSQAVQAISFARQICTSQDLSHSLPCCHIADA